MEIVESAEKAPEITEKIRKIMLEKIYSREPPDRIWLTDTVYCGRKKIFRMLGLGEAIPESAIARIWLGIVVGQYLQSAGVASEVRVEYRGIAGRIDVTTDTGEPVEIKARQKPYTAASEVNTSYIEQLSRYCLATGRETGILFQYIAGLELAQMPATRYRFNLRKVAQETDRRIELLEAAKSEQNPFILPPTWHSASLDNWECRQCNFRKICSRAAKI